MDPALLHEKNAPNPKAAEGTPHEMVHTDFQLEAEAPKLRSRKELPRELTWLMMQAETLTPDKQTVSYRSFPFYALTVEHAIKDIMEMAAAHKGHLPYTHLVVFGQIKQKAGIQSKARLKLTRYNILTRDKE